MQAVGLTEHRMATNWRAWYSVGAQPTYYFNDRFSVALEAGVDWAKVSHSEPMATFKVTLAPQHRGQILQSSEAGLRDLCQVERWLQSKVGGSAYRTVDGYPMASSGGLVVMVRPFSFHQS